VLANAEEQSQVQQTAFLVQEMKTTAQARRQKHFPKQRTPKAKEERTEYTSKCLALEDRNHSKLIILSSARKWRPNCSSSEGLTAAN